MRRILELGTLVLILTTLLTPVSEMLDRWDAPGLANDIEMHLFALVMILALVLLVSRLVSILRHHLLTLVDHGRAAPWKTRLSLEAAFLTTCESVPPQLSPPLRI